MDASKPHKSTIYEGTKEHNNITTTEDNEREKAESKMCKAHKEQQTIQEANDAKEKESEDEKEEKEKEQPQRETNVKEEENNNNYFTYKTYATEELQMVGDAYEENTTEYRKTNSKQEGKKENNVLNKKRRLECVVNNIKEQKGLTVGKNENERHSQTVKETELVNVVEDIWGYDITPYMKEEKTKQVCENNYEVTDNTGKKEDILEEQEEELTSTEEGSIISGRGLLETTTSLTLGDTDSWSGYAEEYDDSPIYREPDTSYSESHSRSLGSLDTWSLDSFEYKDFIDW